MDVSQVRDCLCFTWTSQSHYVYKTSNFVTFFICLLKILMFLWQFYSFMFNQLCPFSGPLCVCAHSGVCQLQVPVLYQDWRHTGGRPVPEGAGCQQQRHPEVAEDEQLSSRLPSRSLYLFLTEEMYHFDLINKHSEEWTRNKNRERDRERERERERERMMPNLASWILTLKVHGQCLKFLRRPGWSMLL